MNIRRRQWLHWGLGSAVAGAAAGCARWHGEAVWRERMLLGFGTALRLQAAHRSAERVEAALDEAVQTLQRIHAQMSLFDAGSELSRLNRDGRLEAPPPELREVLTLARDVSAASGGLFDVTVQPLWTCWETAHRAGRRPTAEELDAARALVGWQRLAVERHAIGLAGGAQVTLNGIAQGYAADCARRVLVRHGITDALVDAGEYAPLGQGRGGRPWRLGIADAHDEQRLLARLALDGRCVATSSDAGHRFSADRRHHHILDPRNGASPPLLSSVTVVAGQGALADALTKVMFIAGPERIPALAQAWGADVLWVDKLGRWSCTPGLRPALQA